MPNVKLFRFWQKDAGAVSVADTLAHAAAAGESLERLLELGARSLLTVGEADRAGVWLPGEKQPGTLEGVVLDAFAPHSLHAWNCLDAAHPAIVELLRSNLPVVLEVSRGRWAEAIPRFVGMKVAAFLPLRRGQQALGLAVAAYAHAEPPADISRLEAFADHLVVALSQWLERGRAESLASRLQNLADLHKAIASGEDASTLLKRFAWVARRVAGASFLAVGRRADGGTGVSFAALDGPPEFVSLLGDPSLAPVWRAVVQERRATAQNLPSTGREGNPGSPSPWPETATLLALPLEAGGELLGVLVAGLGPTASPVAAQEALQPLAALAAVLQRDALRSARSAGVETALANLLEAGSEMILLLDAGGRVQLASRAARDFLGWDPHGQVGPRLEELFPASSQGEVAAWRAAGEGEVPTGRTEPLELVLRGGRVVRLRARTADLPEGQWCAAIEDVTELRSAEHRGRETEAELAAVLDSMASGALVFDRGGKLRWANARFAQLFGLEPRRLAAVEDFESLLRVTSNRFRDSSAVERRWREIFRRGDEAAWDELEVTFPSRRVVERFARPVLGPEGGPIGWLEVYRDITSERLIESKLLQTEKMAALGQLVSGIAHELNNPLTSIMGYAQLLLGRAKDPHRTADAQRIFEEAQRAGRIVKNLLLFAREEKPERKAVSLNEVVERTVALRSYELGVQNIAVDRELDEDLPVLLADSHQLQQVVLNLVVNAEQAIQQGRGSGRISIRTWRLSPQRAALEVADDGPGIPSEILSRIFDPFFTTKPVGVGTGLGLSIVYGVVQEHGGAVSVESEPGQGSRFVVELPLMLDPASQEAEAPAAPRKASQLVAARSGRQWGGSSRVLVVEDEPTVAQLVVDVLREEGHEAAAFLDSVEALHHLSVEPFDLVICDWKMPRLDGQGFYQALMRNGSFPSHRIIFITGDTMTPRTVDFLERNGLTYLAKPFLVEELKQTVNRALESPSLRVASPQARLAGSPGSKRNLPRPS